ncbi:hypothetical protein C8R46DRAFT_904084, partial [Mycena filopes]
QFLSDMFEVRDEKTGEKVLARMLREEREWAAAKSAEFREQGNVAFRSGDYKAAYVLYTAAMCRYNVEPFNCLNRAAVALKLKMYSSAVEDATDAMEKGDFNRAKALFRRAQGSSFLGEWCCAEEDYKEALALQPGDRNVLDGLKELRRLRSLPVNKQTAWISEQNDLSLEDVFEDGVPELKRRVEEVLGHPVPE